MSDVYDSYDYQSASSINFPQTQSTDLEMAGMDGGGWYTGTSALPAVSEIPRSDSAFDFSGILKPITATANSLLGLWGQVQNINTSAATQKATAEINTAKLDLAKTQAFAGIDIAKTQATTAQNIAKIQAENQVAKESMILANTKGGTFSAVGGSSNFLVLAGLGVSLWLAFRGKK